MLAVYPATEDRDQLSATPDPAASLPPAKDNEAPAAGLAPAGGCGGVGDATADPGRGFGGLNPSHLPPTPEEIEQLKPRRVPSARNRDIYREVKILNRSERDVAEKFDIAQPRVHAICKQVLRWLKAGQADLDGLSAEEKLNLCTNNARIRLSLTYSTAIKWLEATGAIQQSEQTRSIAGIPQWTDVVRKNPNPKPAFLGYMLRAAVELAKLEGVYDGKCGVRNAECGVHGMTNDQASMTNEIPNRQSQIPNSFPSATPQSALRNPHSIPPDELLSPGAAKSDCEQTSMPDDDSAKAMRADGCSEESIAEVARRKKFKAQKSRYRALAAACGLAHDHRELFEDLIIDLELAAENADAFARERLAAESVRLGEPSAAGEPSPERLAHYRRQFLENLVQADFHFVPEAYRAVLARYQPVTGRFDWWLETGQGNDLAAIVLEPS